MNSKEEKTDFVSSSKMEDMGKEKVVVEPKEEKSLTPSEVKEKKSFTITYFILESIVFVSAILIFLAPAFDSGPSIYVDISIGIMLFLFAFSLLNTYFYIFKLEPRFRITALILRIVFVISAIFAFGAHIVDSVDSIDEKLAFNRTVSLRDTWAKIEKGQSS